MVRCEYLSICPSTTVEGAQPPNICLTWMWDAVWKVLQTQPWNSGMICTLHHLGLQPTLANVGNLCGGGNIVSVQPYAHPQYWKALNHLIHVWHGCEMKFERFYSLNHGIVAWFAHFITWDFSQLLRMWETFVVVWCEYSAICPSTTVEGAQPPNICLSWMWDEVWKVLQLQPWNSGMICTLHHQSTRGGTSKITQNKICPNSF